MRRPASGVAGRLADRMPLEPPGPSTPIDWSDMAMIKTEYDVQCTNTAGKESAITLRATGPHTSKIQFDLIVSGGKRVHFTFEQWQNLVHAGEQLSGLAVPPKTAVL